MIKPIIQLRILFSIILLYQILFVRKRFYDKMYLVIEMTEKLYMINSYLNEVEGKVLLNRKVGDEYHTILDKTIFYPDGVGGQRGDKGWINDVIVEKSIEKVPAVLHWLK